MDTTSLAKSPTAVRWVVPLALLVVCIVLVTSLLRDAGVPAEQVLILMLLSTALAVSTSVLYPTAGSLPINLIMFCTLTWVWTVQRTPAVGWQLTAFGVLVGIAMWQRRLRSRRLQRMQQILDDLGDDRGVKDQAIAQIDRTRDALQKKLSRYTTLRSIAEELSNTTDLTSIASLAVERAFTLIGNSDACLLFLVNEDAQELALFASKRSDAIANIRAKRGDQFDRHVLRTHRPLLVNDTRRDFRFTSSASRDRQVSSVIACPLVVGQSPIGVLRLDSSRPNVYTQDDLRFLDILLNLTAAAVTNARLFAKTQLLAITDGLTGLTLRRPFLEQLTRELARAGRSREPVSLMMLDVDHFKSYNDTFGHTAGDLVLRGVAKVLRAVVPPGGVVGRYGGEEFVVLLPRMPRHQASDVAEKIRHTIERDFRDGRPGATTPSAESRRSTGPRATASTGPRQPVTVSLGIASFPDDAQVELELIRVADKRLYQAKHAGRNLVCSA